ncbi:MAG: hypothetical protein QXR62_06500 [Candidatus Bathyarchaeia archaeon]
MRKQHDVQNATYIDRSGIYVDTTIHTKTLKLIRSIDSGSIVDGSIEELAELAGLNKVMLGFLRRICYDGTLRNREENRYKRYMSEVAEISKALSSLDYALFKFRKPIEHVSVDIDILNTSYASLESRKNVSR